MSTQKRLQPLTINEPVVVVPLDDYRALLAEAGYLPTPKLSRQITAARARFRKGRYLSWESLKRDLR